LAPVLALVLSVCGDDGDDVAFLNSLTLTLTSS
jgi:hypothetical protein